MGPGFRRDDRGAPAVRLALSGQLAAVRSVLPLLWPENAPEARLRVVAALGCLGLAKLANVYIPMFFKGAVDALGVVPPAVIAVPLGFLLAYGIARVLAQLMGELRDAVFAKVAQAAVQRIALDAFRHLHGLSLRFHLDRRTGGLTRSIERGAEGIEFLLSFVLFNILPTILEILLVAGILWSFYDWRFAAVTLATIGAYIWFTLTVTEWRIKFRRAMNESETDAYNKAVDSLLNYETVKYFGNEEHEARRYGAALETYGVAAVRSKTSLSVLNVGQSVVIAIGVVLMMLMAAQGVARGVMTVGDFVLVNAYLIQLYLPLNFLGTVYREIRQSLIDMEALFELMRAGIEVEDRPGAPALALTQGEVEFDAVDFQYDPRRPILEGVGFRVGPGRAVAIVGPSGSGKTTIGRLLFRFYDVTGGAIRIDGQDISEVRQDSLRAAIGVVPQDTVLFNDTIYYNIAYGRPDASRAEIEEAARIARIHDFVRSLPDGYDTMVGERGLKLSGGEKQRVAIARTLLKKPAILLFDEATSALDTRTEKEIQASLTELAKGHTTLIIAHRLSTVIHADEILVLEAGRVVERGRHADLLAAGGVYASMWRRQQEAARAESVALPAADG